MSARRRGTPRPARAGAAPLAAAFRDEELAGLRLAARARAGSLAIVAVLLPVLMPDPAVLAYEVAIAGFVGLGFAHLALRRRSSRPWIPYVFVALDFALLTVTLQAPNPLMADPLTAPLRLRLAPFAYFFLLLSGVAFSYSPRLMLWAGAAGAASWGAGVVWVLQTPGVVTPATHGPRAALPMRAAELLDPGFVHTHLLLQEIAAFVLTAAILAIVVARSRRLVERQSEVARERENLSRYFPPTMVEALARLDRPLADVRAQPVAVLFADIVGFTQLAERQAPLSVVQLLREFHGRMEGVVFDHGGTLDKFLGDGLMATFGTPHVGPHDAANALACARAVLSSIDEWNVDRAAAGAPPVRVSVGLHYGDVVLGDLGSKRRMEFGVIGDAVNVASRLEELTRELGCRVAASAEVVETVRRDLDRPERLLAGFHERRPLVLRGRRRPVTVWTLGDGAGTPEAAGQPTA